MAKPETIWVTKWKLTVSATPILPYVWLRKEGGYVVRGQRVDPKTGKPREVRKILAGPEYEGPSGAAKAQAWLLAELDKIAAGGRKIPTFKSYANSVFEGKIADGTIQSAAGQEKWAIILEHLFKAPWADFIVTQVKPSDLIDWRDSLPKLTWVPPRKTHTSAIKDVIRRRREPTPRPYAATTLNDWLNIARVIFNLATIKYELARNPMLGVEDFQETSRTYTREEPNALTPEEVGAWLDEFKRRYPHLYAMAFVGLVHGQRPSSLRPLRRKGPTPDIVLDGDRPHLLIRQSHTIGDEVWDQTKTKKDVDIALHPEVVAVLKWHIDTQLETPEQQASDLLFPTEEGRLHNNHCLRSPFKLVTKAVGLRKKITPRAMRRTFQDLTRANRTEGVVVKAISGHATDAMRNHYSTPADGEVLTAVGKVIDLAKVRAAKTA